MSQVTWENVKECLGEGVGLCLFLLLKKPAISSWGVQKNEPVRKRNHGEAKCSKHIREVGRSSKCCRHRYPSGKWCFGLLGQKEGATAVMYKSRRRIIWDSSSINGPRVLDSADYVPGGATHLGVRVQRTMCSTGIPQLRPILTVTL